ncbi:protein DETOXIFICATION 24-like isoform X1 [Hibiscus syriacus]|uniref:protein DETOXIFICATION 24-like isoform X1 n=2 Tax=Hibiscus syriacus TaxID=106335 RepID=UPI001923B09A|nr:protein DETOXIFICATION 24-like isoform X1 [Hibiscus syriacus]
MDERLLKSQEPKENNNSNLRNRVWEESKQLWKIGFPSILARVTAFGMFVVTQAFIGHISQLELAAYALIQVIAVRFSNGILLGMSSATETLCGQAFGAKQYHMLGIYLQRSWIINLLTSAVLLPVFIFASSIFELLGENEDIASAAGYISLWFIPILYSFVFNFTIQKYLQCQLKNTIVGWISTASFSVHLLLSWIFVSKLNWGIPGAMSSMIISTWLVLIGEFIYVFGGWCPNTWNGFTSAAFLDLFGVLKLSISSGVMLCLELWYYAVLVLLAGYMKNAAVAIDAFSICLNIIAWQLMISFGFLTATSVRVSNELGRGNAQAAKFSVKVITCTSLCIGVFFWALCLIFGHQIGYLFTREAEVANSVADLSVLLSISVLLNSVQPILSGVAIGAGRQKMVAYVNICSYYAVGVPLGILLAYVAKMEAKGLWIGMIIGVATQTVVLAYITSRTDWEDQVNKASERLNKWSLRPSETSEEKLIDESMSI